jgi:hypothetical protein
MFTVLGAETDGWFLDCMGEAEGGVYVRRRC